MVSNFIVANLNICHNWLLKTSHLLCTQVDKAKKHATVNTKKLQCIKDFENFYNCCARHSIFANLVSVIQLYTDIAIMYNKIFTCTT